MINFRTFSAISRPRFRAVSGNPLPSPRLVSIVVHADVSHLVSDPLIDVVDFGCFSQLDIVVGSTLQHSY
jgi:hypothetical protein